MKYEVKNIKTDVVNQSEDGLSIITKSVVESGIVGDTYGFTKHDNLSVTTLKTLTVDETQAKIKSEADKMIATKYPNT